MYVCACVCHGLVGMCVCVCVCCVQLNLSGSLKYGGFLIMEVKQCTIWDQRGYNNTSVHIDMYVCVYVCIYVCLCVCVYNILCVCKLSKQEVDGSTTEKL